MTDRPIPSAHVFAHYDDARSAIDWLCDAFGLERRQVHEGEDGTIVDAELGIGSTVFMVSDGEKPSLGLRSPKGLGAVTGGVYVHLPEGIDEHFERARAAGAEIVFELGETEYGSREYTARDPQGHLWSFGTYAPG